MSIIKGDAVREVEGLYLPGLQSRQWVCFVGFAQSYKTCIMGSSYSATLIMRIYAKNVNICHSGTWTHIADQCSARGNLTRGDTLPVNPWAVIYLSTLVPSRRVV